MPARYETIGPKENLVAEEKESVLPPDESEPSTRVRQWLSSSSNKSLGLVFGGLMLLSGLAGYSLGGGGGVDLESSAAPSRLCTFDECGRASCDPASAPFLCVDPKTAYYGCSALPWATDSCSDSCDMTSCATTKPSQDQASCAGVKCPADRCDPDTRYQRCGESAPYQCLKGSSAMGCSDDPYGWVLAADTTCSECCDDSAC
jgi:hypothetical protein